MVAKLRSKGSASTSHIFLYEHDPVQRSAQPSVDTDEWHMVSVEVW